MNSLPDKSDIHDKGKSYYESHDPLKNASMPLNSLNLNLTAFLFLDTYIHKNTSDPSFPQSEIMYLNQVYDGSKQSYYSQYYPTKVKYQSNQQLINNSTLNHITSANFIKKMQSASIV